MSGNKFRFLLIISFVFVQLTQSFAQLKTSVNYVNSFDNSNHPQIAYWFFNKDMLTPERYESKIDSISKYSKYTFIFLTARNGVDFYDIPKMHPIFERLVNYAHSKGLKIGLQLWERRYKVPLEVTERMIQEGEVVLDENGAGKYQVKSNFVRDARSLIKSELFRVYAFKKTNDGFYQPGTLTDITAQCNAGEGKEMLDVTLNAGSKLKSYTAFILTQHYYNYCSNHSSEALNNLVNVMKSYSDIRFDGVGLDEYTNMRVSTTWELNKNKDVFRGRPYSIAMGEKLKQVTGQDAARVLLDMRYAPSGKPEVRVTAINQYMGVMRSGTMSIEKAIYDKGKEFFGREAFIGLHNTHHNSLDGDEAWQTGLNWWNVKRDYGHSDEGSPTCTRLGIGFNYPMNVMYNMFYDKSLTKITNKAAEDLIYGIRTHYHAINDVQKWGVSVEQPEALAEINKVENAARLLNQFNPAFPKIKLLVVFGMESLLNWYPDSTKRSITDINKSLKIEEKAQELWNAGYLNVLMPTDVIADGRLRINANGKPQIQGHEFDAMIFLYPQYARQSTLDFLKKYVDKGGKLMVEGAATYDFDGKDCSKQWNEIAAKAMLKSFNPAEVSKLGIFKRAFTNGVCNEDGSFTFGDIKDVQNLTLNGHTFSIGCNGFAAIDAKNDGQLKKLVATSFKELRRDGKVIIALSKPADISVMVKDGVVNVRVADETKSIKVNVEL